jgi:catechol 2,3-dioxygenase-like lactoylglutathione lyase family enzyme
MERRINASIRHVGIEVSNLEEAKSFYNALAEALDLEKIYESGETVGWGNDDFHIWATTSKKPRVKKGPPSGEEEVVAEHLAIHVGSKKEVDSVDEVMRRKGFKPLFSPEALPQFTPGYYAASYCDPDNYVIEIFTLH